MLDMWPKMLFQAQKCIDGYFELNCKELIIGIHELDVLRSKEQCNEEQMEIINTVIGNIIIDYCQKTLEFNDLKLLQKRFKIILEKFAKGYPQTVSEIYDKILNWKRDLSEIC